MNRPLLIGYGAWGRKVATKLTHMGLAPIAVIEPTPRAGCYDGYPGSQAHPIEHTIDAWAATGGTATHAIVCTPPYHGRLRTVSDLLAHGIENIHLAKPACVDVEELDELLALTDCGVRITVGHTTLYSPTARALVDELATAGAVHIDALRDTPGHPLHGGSPMVDLSAHDLALLTTQLGDGVSVVYAARTATQYLMSLAWECGSTATLSGGWDQAHPDRHIRIAPHQFPGYEVLLRDLPVIPDPDPLEQELTAALAFRSPGAYLLEDAAIVIRVLAEAEQHAAENAARLEQIEATA